MPNRPSTAEILAAARAADGKRRGEASPVAATRARASSGKAREDEGAVAVVEPDEAPDQDKFNAVESNGHLTDVPPRTALMVAAVRNSPNGTASPSSAPPSVASMLAGIRGQKRNGAVLAAPPSIARMLADVRGEVGPIAVNRVSRAEESPKSKSPPAATHKPRGNTADILAAARQQGAAKSGSSSGKSMEQSASRVSPNNNGNPGGTASRTADILAAARKQGDGQGAGKATSPTTAPARRKQPRAAKEGSGAVKPSSPMREPTDNRPQPKSIAEILAAVRCDSAGGTAPLEYPPLSEMIASLRHQSHDRLSQRVRSPALESSWMMRVRNWFRGRADRIAVRQFDQS